MIALSTPLVSTRMPDTVSRFVAENDDQDAFHLVKVSSSALVRHLGRESRAHNTIHWLLPQFHHRIVHVVDLRLT